ncbi:MAG: helix-turn-helix transcriptional regulator [Roseitalea porphyridii]
MNVSNKQNEDRFHSGIDAFSMAEENISSVMDLVSEKSRGVQSHLFEFELSEGKILTVQNRGHSKNFPSEFYSLYKKHYTNLSPRMPVAIRMGEFAATVDHDFYTDAEISRSPFHNEFLKQFDLRYAVFAPIKRTSNRLIVMSVDRSEVMAPFSVAEKDAFSRDCRLLRSALDVAENVREMMVFNKLWVEALNQIGDGVVLLSADGKIKTINSVARDMVLKRRGIGTVNGQLVATDTSSDVELQRAVYEARESIKEKKIFRSRTISLYLRGARRSITAHLYPLGQEVTENFGRGFVLFLRDPNAKLYGVELQLSELYGLTPVEAAIAVWLANGGTLDGYCDTYGVTRNTVRSHLKHIFLKTDCNQQSELVALVIRSIMPAPAISSRLYLH